MKGARHNHVSCDNQEVKKKSIVHNTSHVPTGLKSAQVGSSWAQAHHALQVHTKEFSTIFQNIL
jgi:hypothetical protein